MKANKFCSILMMLTLMIGSAFVLSSCGKGIIPVKTSTDEGKVSTSCAKGLDFYNKNNYTEAVKWFRKAAEKGDVLAQLYLGDCYRKGQGVSRDYTEAVKWYRKAAEQGDAVAQYNLGVCYNEGVGVSQDYYEAVKWFRKAAEQGSAAAQHNLGVCNLLRPGCIARLL